MFENILFKKELLYDPRFYTSSPEGPKVGIMKLQGKRVNLCKPINLTEPSLMDFKPLNTPITTDASLVRSFLINYSFRIYSIIVFEQFRPDEYFEEPPSMLNVKNSLL
jgi:hypothetical protein